MTTTFERSHNAQTNDPSVAHVPAAHGVHQAAAVEVAAMKLDPAKQLVIRPEVAEHEAAVERQAVQESDPTVEANDNAGQGEHTPPVPNVPIAHGVQVDAEDN